MLKCLTCGKDCVQEDSLTPPDVKRQTCRNTGLERDRQELILLRIRTEMSIQRTMDLRREADE